MAKKRGGRSRKVGQRFPSGKLKTVSEGMSPALWKRLRTAVLKEVVDPRLVSEVGRLNAAGHLTDTQAATGVRIGEIYQRYFKYKRIRTNPKTATYERGAGGGADLAEERMDEEQLETYERAVRAAEADWKLIDEEIPVYPREVNAAVIDLCVHDRSILSSQFADVRLVLDRIAIVLGERWKRQHQSNVARPPRQVRGQPVKPAPKAKPAVTEADDPNLVAMEKTVRRLRPDLDGAGLRQCMQAFVGVRRLEEHRTRRKR